MSTNEKAPAAEADNGSDPVTVIVGAEARGAQEIVEKLTQLGWQVTLACGNDDLAGTTCDVVIAAHTPSPAEMDSLCRRMLRGAGHGNWPLLVITGAPAERHTACLAAGADGVLGPEETLESLVAHLRALVRRVRAERDCSPLTGLPGNARLEQVIRRRLAAGETPAVLMLDIDNFKAFNDRYGHWRGDRVIEMLGEVARAAAATDPEALLAHVGGDDFCVVTTPGLVDEIADRCREGFDAQAPLHYDGGDRLRGTITTRSRDGRRRQHKLMTLTLAAATAEADDMKHIGQFFQVLAELKEYAKGHGGSSYVKDRRRHHGWDSARD